MRRTAPSVLAALCLVAALLAAGPARAHALRLSTGEWRVQGPVVTAELQFSRVELAGLEPSTLTRAVEVSADGRPCELEAATGAPAENDGVRVDARWRCGADMGAVRIRLGFLALLPEGHVHVALLHVHGGTVQRSARAASPLLEAEAPPPWWVSAGRFLRLGVEHIFGGPDHIAFLLGVLLLGGTFRQLAGIVTAFTAAHSVTLALATLGLLVPPPSVIEPLIALSIVAVAAENLWALRPPPTRARVQAAIARRWRITFAFGLVHGFGFASALRGLELPRGSLAASLVTFNLGVETGQLVIVGLAWPVLHWLRSLRGTWPWGLRIASGLLAAVGTFWVVQRLVEGG